jgi:hypothetical protein
MISGAGETVSDGLGDEDGTIAAWAIRIERTIKSKKGNINSTNSAGVSDRFMNNSLIIEKA